MASIQHYVCDADIFPLEIIKKHATLENLEKERHYAALKIQRLWRGYIVRKEIARWNHAAIVLQKYIRRWLVQWHLPDFYKDYLDWYRNRYFDQMATKIQARWRGYWVRRDRIPIKELIARRKAIEQANEDIQRQMKEAFENMEKLKMEQMEREAYHWVLYILFKLHHHLRTHTREGIYSNHGDTKDSNIERLLRAIPMRQYMDLLREVYYEEISKPKKPPQYTFKTKNLHRIEDMYRERDRSNEPKKTVEPEYSIDLEPFKLTPKLKEEVYKRLIIYDEQYDIKKRFSFTRPLEKHKHMSEKDFDLHTLKKVKFPLKPPPYYIDFWSKICEIHNIPDL